MNKTCRDLGLGNLLDLRSCVCGKRWLTYIQISIHICLKYRSGEKNILNFYSQFSRYMSSLLSSVLRNISRKVHFADL